MDAAPNFGVSMKPEVPFNPQLTEDRILFKNQNGSTVLKHSGEGPFFKVSFCIFMAQNKFTRSKKMGFR